MSTTTASARLEVLRKIVQAALNTEHRYPGIYVDGINAGLLIALDAINRELKLSRDLEEAIDSQHQ